jgi:DNA-binding MarR family transcriptional regulator
MSVTLTSLPASGPDTEANLGYLFRLAYQRFRLALEEVLRDLDLSAQEYGILSVFETRPELSSAELARIAQVSRQTMHVAVVRLAKAGLVERKATNQRVVAVRLTKRGRDRLKAATKRVRGVESAALAGLSDGNERAVRRWLSTVAAMPVGARPEDRATRDL